MEAVGKLSNAQMELLKLFKYDLPEKQLAEMKKHPVKILCGYRQ